MPDINFDPLQIAKISPDKTPGSSKWVVILPSLPFGEKTMQKAEVLPNFSIYSKMYEILCESGSDASSSDSVSITTFANISESLSILWDF